MYVIPIVALALLVAIGAVWSPIFALIIAVPLFLLFLAYVGLSRSSFEGEESSPAVPGRGEGADDRRRGFWGQKSV